MNEPFLFVLAGSAGLVLGAIFFGGLWWTVRKGLVSKRPAPLFLGSMLLRVAVVLTGFYFVGRGDWRRLLACLVGFVVARFVVTWFTRAPLEQDQTPEASREP